MPSTSKKQHNFMAAVANNPAFAKKVGVPQSVGKDFSNADKGKTFKRGDDMAKAKKMAFGGMSQGMGRGRPANMPMRGGGFFNNAGSGRPTILGSGINMKKGGMPMKMKDGKKVPIFMSNGGSASKRADGIAIKGKTKGKMMAKGGRTC